MSERNWRLAKARTALNEVFIDPESGAEEIIGSFTILMEDCSMYVEQVERRMGGSEQGEPDPGAGWEEEENG